MANIYVRQNFEHKFAQAQTLPELPEKQLPLVKEQADAATTALHGHRTSDGFNESDVKTKGILPGINELRAQIKQLQQKSHELRQKYSKSHPAIAAIDKQIAGLQSQMNAGDKKKLN